MSTRISLSHQADLSNTNSELEEPNSFLSERVPLNYSVCLEKLKGAPISNSYRSCFTPYQPSLIQEDNKKQLTTENYFTLPQLKQQFESIQKLPFISKIQSLRQSSESYEDQQSAKMFQYLKTQQNKEQDIKNVNFVRTKDDIIFAKCVDNPPWPCQIKKIQRMPGMVPQIMYYVKFISENTFSWVTQDQIVSFTNLSCQYVKHHSKNKKLKKAIKISIKKAEKNLQRLYSQKITRENSQSTQSNQRQVEKQHKSIFQKLLLGSQITRNETGFFTLKKQLISTPQLTQNNFKPIILAQNTQKQKKVQNYLSNLKQSLQLKKLTTVKQKQKRQKIPKVIKIIGIKKSQNQISEKTVIEFKKSKTTSKRQNTKSLNKDSKKFRLKKSVPKDLIIQTPKLPLSFFQRIQKFDKKLEQKVQKNQIYNKKNANQNHIQKIPYNTSQKNDKIQKKYEIENNDEYSRYSQDENKNNTQSIELEIEYEKESDHYDSQTSLEQNSKSEDFFNNQKLNKNKQDKMQDFQFTITQKRSNTQQLTKQQEMSLIKHIQSYNDQLFKVRNIKNKEEVENEIIQMLCKTGPYNIAYSQIVDELCMMTGLLKQEKNKNPQCYFFYNEVIKQVQKLVSRMNSSTKKGKGQQTESQLKTRRCVENKIWLLKSCLNLTSTIE